MNEPTLYEMKKYFTDRTLHHICLVAKYLNKLGKFDMHHDESKFQDPEYQPYLYISWDYKCKDEGIKYKIPEKWQDKCHEVTFHHMKNNKHHPEYWDDELVDNPINKQDRDKPSGKIVNAIKMPEEYILEMVADWCAMSEEKGNTPKEWADKNVGKRWKFSSKQKDLIYEVIDFMWE